MRSQSVILIWAAVSHLCQPPHCGWTEAGHGQAWGWLADQNSITAWPMPELALPFPTPRKRNWSQGTRASRGMHHPAADHIMPSCSHIHQNTARTHQCTHSIFWKQLSRLRQPKMRSWHPETGRAASPRGQTWPKPSQHTARHSETRMQHDAVLTGFIEWSWMGRSSQKSENHPKENSASQPPQLRLGLHLAYTLSDMHRRDSDQHQWVLAPRPKNEFFAQGGVHQNRDIVDTKTHASCAARQNKDKQSPFPTTWGKAERTKWKAQ